MPSQISPEFLQLLTNSLVTVFILILISLSARYLLVALGQNWIRTFSHTATLLILPIITFVITKVISGNIALSLGMVGALSIVRFRNPVKSPFELAVYFASITMGITASVSLPWLLFFALAIGLAVIVMIASSLVSEMVFKKPMFQTSFSEGNQLCTLEIQSRSQNEMLMNSEMLINLQRTEDLYFYTLVSSDITELKDLCSDLEEDPNITDFQLSA
tara:strand:- start:1760 stop:2410 length:651 start_codon:yes stop_codon:yes gene_type:complete